MYSGPIPFLLPFCKEISGQTTNAKTKFTKDFFLATRTWTEERPQNERSDRKLDANPKKLFHRKIIEQKSGETVSNGKVWSRGKEGLQIKSPSEQWVQFISRLFCPRDSSMGWVAGSQGLGPVRNWSTNGQQESPKKRGEHLSIDRTNGSARGRLPP